jgi:hypothetical protein
MRTIQAKLVRADGQRVNVTIRNTSMLAMLYHLEQVYPGHTSSQLIVIAREKARPAC